jgi:hypothetical protein
MINELIQKFQLNNTPNKKDNIIRYLIDLDIPSKKADSICTLYYN